MIEKETYLAKFESDLHLFIKELNGYVSTESGEWTVKGFIDIYKNIYTISADTKIISKILEIHIFPEILRFAKEAGYKLVLAEHQNWYPDITFINVDNHAIKFALDLKTTFRRSNNTVSFTLGSHGAYFKDRDKDKNIQFPYNHYLGHFCLGIIYTRTDFDDDLADTEVFQVHDLQEDYGENLERIGQREVTKVENLKSITSVIKDFEFFAAPKWKIASDARGSGNTANIGSIKNIKDIKAGRGVFSELGEEWFDEYWINYGKATLVRDGKTIPITNIWDYLEFKGRTDLFPKVGKGAKKRNK